MTFTAATFLARLRELQSDEELAKIRRYFKTGTGQYGEGDEFIGVRMGHVFALAQEFILMPLDEVEKLLESPVHEARAGAVSIMARQFRARRTTDARRGEIYALYLRRHDRINNWDLVDLGAWHIVGGWLKDKPRTVLYELAESEVIWERRTAMLATIAFVGSGNLDDCYAIAEKLLGDREDIIHKPIGWVLRECGKKDKRRLLDFIDRHYADMPRVALRGAIEKFDAAERKAILGRK